MADKAKHINDLLGSDVVVVRRRRTEAADMEEESTFVGLKAGRLLRLSGSGVGEVTFAGFDDGIVAIMYGDQTVYRNGAARERYSSGNLPVRSREEMDRILLQGQWSIEGLDPNWFMKFYGESSL